MDIKWAIKKLDEGKKIRRKCWGIKTYYIKKDGNHLIDSDITSCNLSFEELSATDWELYKKPKTEWVEMTNKEICETLRIREYKANPGYLIGGQAIYNKFDYKVKLGKLFKKKTTD